ncbi:hypothetical protein [Kineosporia sp. A_224]|uniref:hypothetical protein n=1 Tax=Kineosporia sp. A_224 TaxID=1962180 RepID=UPI000B4A973F|nr:hypothetical protein [Kineosporia sp. A_224]
MLTPILATPDPYRAADEFVANGWTLVFATPQDSGDPLAAVELHGAQVLLGVDTEQFLPTAARDHRGAGVQLYVEVPAERLDAVHATHAAPGPVADRAWGVRAFTATIAGYSFMVATRSER